MMDDELIRDAQRRVADIEAQIVLVIRQRMGGEEIDHNEIVMMFEDLEAAIARVCSMKDAMAPIRSGSDDNAPVAP